RRGCFFPLLFFLLTAVGVLVIIFLLQLSGCQQYTVRVEEVTYETVKVAVGSDGLVFDETKGRDVVLVVDTSGSMKGVPLAKAKEAAKHFFSKVMGEENTRAGLVQYADKALVLADLDSSAAQLKEKTDALSSKGQTNIYAGLLAVEEIFADSGDRNKIIVLLSDGFPTKGKSGKEIVEYANQLKEDGYQIYTLGFFHAEAAKNDGDKKDGVALLTRIATDDLFFEVNDPEELDGLLGAIAEEIIAHAVYSIRLDNLSSCKVFKGSEYLSSSRYNYNDAASFGSMTAVGGPNGSAEFRLFPGEYKVEIITIYDEIIDYALTIPDGGDIDIKSCISSQHALSGMTVGGGSARLFYDSDRDGLPDTFYRVTAEDYTVELDEEMVFLALVISAAATLIFFILFCVSLRGGRKTTYIYRQ
ncbi:MAG: VWA domain-containing protein, partial [Oscillospiraceae bacterium]|nr:VWA domain-containing protein [Oscillospiraceae bacterium]